MDTSTPITEEYKNNIYSMLADALIHGLERESFPEDDSHISSQFILDRLDPITSREKLLVFLEELSSKWPAYKEVYATIMGEQEEIKDNIKIQEMRDKLQSSTN